MRIDLQERKNRHLKNKNISMITMFIFLFLTIVSIVCFVVFSNYKIQLLMSILGSVISSILISVSIGFMVFGYFPNKRFYSFYTQLENKEEQSIKGQIKLTNKYVTLRKGLFFLVIYINEDEHYVIDEEMVNSLINGKEYKVLLRDNFVMEITDYE